MVVGESICRLSAGELASRLLASAGFFHVAFFILAVSALPSLKDRVTLVTKSANVEGLWQRNDNQMHTVNVLRSVVHLTDAGALGLDAGLAGPARIIVFALIAHLRLRIPTVNLKLTGKSPEDRSRHFARVFVVR